jgi:hypothetical protein
VNIYKILLYSSIVCFIPSSQFLAGRSVHRTKDPLIPTIQVEWLHDPKESYTFSNRHLQEYPLTLFNKQFFNQNLLPAGPITYRNNKKAQVKGTELSAYIEHLLEEINNGADNYRDFTVLHDKDFNGRKKCGLKIFLCKHHPFVLKLFIETPESFINPWGKGFVPIFFFYMAGGASRHLSGFTRIANLHAINEQIAADPVWSSRVETPRKWFWLPEKSRWLKITGANIGRHKKLQVKIPAVYGVIADAIEPERTFSTSNKEDSSTALAICNMLEMRLDPHITNFMIEKDTHKIVIIDTEHFPTIVGNQVKKEFHGYFSWYLDLMGACAKNMLFSTKEELRLAQQANAAPLAPSALTAPETPHALEHAPQLC